MESGWRFSHNSLREYLVAEALVAGLERHRLVNDTVAVSDAMKIFAGAIETERRQRLIEQLSREWTTPAAMRARGQLLTLLWDGLVRLYPKDVKQREACFKAITGEPPQLAKVVLSDIQISAEASPTSLENADFSGAQLYRLGFIGADLTAANFVNATLDSVRFDTAVLRRANFQSAFIIDADFSGSDLAGADFREIDSKDISIILESSESPGKQLLEGLVALGYLRFQGAKTDDVPTIYELQHHAAFPVVDKILEKLAQQALRQRRGLEQRGAARQNVGLARDFVSYLESKGLLRAAKSRKDLVEVTDPGRKVFAKYAGEKVFSEELISFFADRRE